MNYSDEPSHQETKDNSGDWKPEERKAWTERVIKNYAYGSIAVGLVPIPLIDLVALTGLQIKLIHRLSTFYGLPFSEERGKKIISSLVGASVPLGLTRAVCSIFKVIPVIGLTASVITMSGLSAASTYAIGKVFVKHFESGGTFLNLDPTKVKDYYQEQFNKGKTVVVDKKFPE
jgi:uncharacterized protein (DUF697 family)